MIKYICRHCKGDNILIDAYVRWDTETQVYVVETVFDNVECVDCGGETTAIEVSLNQESGQ